VYLIHDDELYHFSALGILQQGIPIEEGKVLLLDIHEGICGHHTSSRSMVSKAFRQGFYWSTDAAAAVQIVRSCKGCQYFARQVPTPAQVLQTISITWPFIVWVLDLFGPFKRAPECFTHLLVAVDKFTKWIKARLMAKICSKQAVSFFQDIVFRFGLPNSIITDNGIQFTGMKFMNFCDDNNIQIDWAAVAHPHSNRQATRTNGMILQGLKPRILTEEGRDVFSWLNARDGKWAAKVPSVL
jgi:hypothetical protein